MVILLSLVMAWGLWVESPGSWVVSPGCDRVGVMGVMIIFLSLVMVITGSWVVGHAMEFLLTLKRGFTFYDNFSLSIRSNADDPHSAPRY